MEPVGLAVGIVGLAGLFSSCLEAVQRFGSWKDYGSEWKSVAAQFEAERILLERWGQAVGLQYSSSAGKHHGALDNPRICSNVTQLLHLIEDLCGSLDDFSISPISRANSAKDGAFRGPRKPDHVAPDSKWQRVKWALGRGEKSTAQVDQFSVLVQKLYALVPPEPQNSQSNSDSAPYITNLNIHIEEKLKDQDDWMLELRQELSRIKEEREAEKRAELQKWLLGNTYSSDTFDVSVRKRLDGTGDWILNKSPFTEWASSDFSNDHAKLLWINGPPGFGKTILCARIVQHLMLTASSVPIAHYFCSSDMAAQADNLIPVRSWLAQLMISPIAFSYVYQAWKSAQDKQKANSSIIVDLLREILEVLPDCTLILDGLDELLQGGETNNSDYLIDDPVVVLLETIKKAVSKTKVRVLFISRDETNIRESLRIDGAWHPVEYRISVDDVRVDIESFSKSIVDKKLSNKPEVMKAEISQQMADRCNGQFLWLRLQENSISRGKNKKQLEKAINETPAGLDRLYDRNWNKILDYPESERARAFSLLRWAAFSLRPLTIFEITEALLISPSEDLDMEDMPDEVDDDYVDSEIFRLCGSLIEIRSSSPESKLGDRTIHMTHFTIKEYFIRRMTNQGGVLSSNPQVHNGILARLCLHYIESDCVWEKSSATNAHWGVFRDYAAGNWHHHVRLCVQDPELVSHVDAFFASASRNWHEWGKWVDLQQVEFHKDDAISRDDLEKTKQRILDDLKTKTSASFSPLYYATLLGLEETVIHLLGLKRYDVNEMGHFGNTPLAIASGHGSLAIATKLIEEGAILSAKNQRECTPLCVAATNNHAEVVNLILQHDPDILVSELEGSTPLQNAAQAGSLESLRLLLAAGAGVNIATKKGATPLYFAALRGHTAIAKELLNHGADITLQDVKGWNALHNAAEKGHLEIFYLLIEKGADITVRDAEGWTALHWAAYGRSFSTAEALISLGADLTIQDHGGWTPLHHAADRGCLNIVQLLLKNGADPTVQDTNGWTPLHWATFGEHLAVIELLIANGADLTIKDNAGGTALHHAAGKDYLSTVELLFKHGAVATVLDSGGWSALHWAAFNGKYSTVKCLIDHGTDPAVKDEDGWTGLDWAARKGHTSILKLFLEHGVSPTNPDSHGWTALHYAALNGQFSTASILVDNGADFEAVDDSGWTALHHASDRGRLNIVQLLLDKRANIEARDSDGWTALHWASSNGRTEVVKVLLQHGADVSVKDRSSGATPLIIAAEGCHSKVVKILLESGSDVNALGYNQKTALLAAARTGLTDAIRVLVDHGSDIEARGRHGRTPLFVASWYGHRETVDILLSCSADVNATDRYGGTPLSAAVKWGHEGVVEALLNSPSICITLPDCLGKTISYWIAKSGKTKIQELVTEHALKKGLEIPKEDLNVEPYGETDMDHRCYICVRPLDEKTWYCCAVCDGGSFLDLDVCSQCFAGGFGCLEKSHALVEIEMRGGTRVERKAMVNDVTNS